MCEACITWVSIGLVFSSQGILSHLKLNKEKRPQKRLSPGPFGASIPRGADTGLRSIQDENLYQRPLSGNEIM